MLSYSKLFKMNTQKSSQDEEQLTLQHLASRRRRHFCGSSVWSTDSSMANSQITDTKSVTSAESGDNVTETQQFHPNSSHKVSPE